MARLLALLPTKTIVDGWTLLDNAMTWAKVPKDMLEAIIKEMGEDELPEMTVLAAVEADEVRTAMGSP